jgi:DNA-binding SARP family transcriptional activator
MAELRVSLLGEFSAIRDDGMRLELRCGKARELFSYLLIHRRRPTRRETLATALWQGASGERGKAYLRRALWRLQAALRDLLGTTDRPVLTAGPEAVQCNPEFEVWLDVDRVEAAYRGAGRDPGSGLDRGSAETLEQAVSLYRGDFLEGHPNEWCQYERERLRHLRLDMLDKLTVYWQSRGNYTEAIACAERTLAHDRARESTHRRLMILHYLAGHRTRALRQYDACVQALRRCLDVEPSEESHRLLRQIRAASDSTAREISLARSPAPSISALLARIEEALATLATLRRGHEDVLTQVRELRKQLGA